MISAPSVFASQLVKYVVSAPGLAFLPFLAQTKAATGESDGESEQAEETRYGGATRRRSAVACGGTVRPDARDRGPVRRRH